MNLFKYLDCRFQNLPISLSSQENNMFSDKIGFRYVHVKYVESLFINMQKQNRTDVSLFNTLIPVLPSNRNQSFDLHSKSVDRFLYESNTGTKWVKQVSK